MKPRNTIVLVIIAHIGLFLIWMCMGGCSINRGQNAVDEIPPKDVKIPGPEEESIGVPTTTGVKEVDVKEEEITTETRTKESGTATAYDETTEVKYVVKSGDTLTKISREFGVTIKELQERNDIQDPKTLREGREIIIPRKGGAKVEKEEPVVEKSIDAETKAKAETTTAAETTTTTAATTGAETTTATTVGKTETATGTTTTGTGTKTGEETKPETTGTDETQYITHEVVAGDTIWKLARTYGVTTDDILKANNITDPKKIQIGQKLLIPKK